MRACRCGITTRRDGVSVFRNPLLVTCPPGTNDHVWLIYFLFYFHRSSSNNRGNGVGWLDGLDADESRVAGRSLGRGRGPARTYLSVFDCKIPLGGLELANGLKFLSPYRWPLESQKGPRDAQSRGVWHGHSHINQADNSEWNGLFTEVPHDRRFPTRRCPRVMPLAADDQDAITHSWILAIITTGLFSSRDVQK